MTDVLVVDDDHGIRDALREALEDHGYVVACAADGNEGLAWLRANAAPGVILLDWMMPNCDGATFRAQQLADATLAGTPVVLLTADVHIEEKTKTLSANAYLKKPVALQTLLATVATFCGTR